MKYEERTPESVKTELESYTQDGANQLEKFLTGWMANEHNGRDFKSILDPKLPPHEQMRLMLGHAYDWFRYGN